MSLSSDLTFQTKACPYSNIKINSKGTVSCNFKTQMAKTQSNNLQREKTKTNPIPKTVNLNGFELLDRNAGR